MPNSLTGRGEVDVVLMAHIQRTNLAVDRWLVAAKWMWY
jgi:hypothetical protein